LRFVPALTKGRILGADLALEDLDLAKPDQPEPRGVPILGYFHNPDKERNQVARRAGVNTILRQAVFEQDPANKINVLLQRALALAGGSSTSHAPPPRTLEIASIPTSQVTRIMIGGRASCPALATKPSA
jgi:hypothetical protein